jgi:hypothetical protein
MFDDVALRDRSPLIVSVNRKAKVILLPLQSVILRYNRLTYVTAGMK